VDEVARRSRRAASVTAAALLGAVVLLAPFSTQARTIEYRTPTMGASASIHLSAADSIAALPLAEIGFAQFRLVDSLLSNWTETSEIAHVNRSANERPVQVGADFAVVLEEALRIHRASDGAFDVTVEPLVRLWGFLAGKPAIPSDDAIKNALSRVGSERIVWDRKARTIRFEPPTPEQPVRIDFGGIAKGYAVDAAAAMLAHQRASRPPDDFGERPGFLVDITGNMKAVGVPTGRTAWWIGIRDPRDRMPYCARLELRSLDAVSTSGQYEQFIAHDGRQLGHILDPRTGWPVEGLISVTVVTPSAMTADAWSTALFVLGPEKARRAAALEDEIAAVLISPGRPGATPDTIWVEAPLADRVALTVEAASLFVIRTY